MQSNDSGLLPCSWLINSGFSFTLNLTTIIVPKKQIIGLYSELHLILLILTLVAPHYILLKGSQFVQ